MKKQQTAASLFIVATPIGNLGDLSPRAREILQQVDWIAAEDTRRTVQLFKELEVTKPLHSLHEHSDQGKVEALVAKLEAGEVGAYVSDAGTPGISDPGAALVRLAYQRNIKVSPIPGASAVTTLLSASGFFGNPFTFQGFFPRENKDRATLCEQVKALGGIHVFFESPHRMEEAMDVVAEAFPGAQLVIGRELTKMFETIVQGRAENARELLASSGERKGEFVFALELPEASESGKTNSIDPLKLFQTIADEGGTHRVLTAVGKALGMPKNEAYELGLKVLKKDGR